jgi:hypothetical protein
MRTLFIALLFVTGCGPSAVEPEFNGCATDEHWRTFDDQNPKAVVSDAMAPAFALPAAGATIAFNRRIKLAWSRSPSDPGQPDGDVPHPARAPYAASPDCVSCCENFNTGGLATFHLPPISGELFDLQLSSGGKLAHRVLTTLQEWVPEDKLWATWRGKQISVKIFRLTVLKNDLKAGPYTPSKPLEFTIGS